MIYHGLIEYYNSSKIINTEVFYYDNSRNIIYNIWKIRKIRADVFHITGDVHYLTPFLFGKKIVNSIHDIGTFKVFTGLKKMLYGLLWVRIPYWLSTYTTTVSEFTKNDLSTYFNIQKVLVIHNPVDSKFTFSPKVFNNELPIILVVGTAPNKNIERIFEALNKIKCKLIIIGKLSKNQKIIIKKYNIKIENYYSITTLEVIDCYNKSDLVVFPSLHEGFGMPIIEANTIGRPVISSNVCSLPEVAGDAAFYVNPLETDEIRNAIYTIINNEKIRIDLIKKGLQNSKRFNMKTIADKYLAVYKQC